MTASKPLPPLNYLRYLFSYDPETGILSRRIALSPASRVGPLPKKPGNHGYLVVSVGGEWGVYLQHRIAWALHHGEDLPPEKVMDHINGDRTDNRLVNLRLVTVAQNASYQSMRSTNTSGFVGVHWSNKERKWIASIWDGKNKLYLGGFPTKEEALMARVEAEAKYHGDHSHTLRVINGKS